MSTQCSRLTRRLSLYCVGSTAAFFPGTRFVSEAALCALRCFLAWIFFDRIPLELSDVPLCSRVFLQVGFWSVSGPRSWLPGRGRVPQEGCAFWLSFCGPQQPPVVGTVQVCVGLAERRFCTSVSPPFWLREAEGRKAFLSLCTSGLCPPLKWLPVRDGKGAVFYMLDF